MVLCDQCCQCHFDLRRHCLYRGFLFLTIPLQCLRLFFRCRRILLYQSSGLREQPRRVFEPHLDLDNHALDYIGVTRHSRNADERTGGNPRDGIVRQRDRGMYFAK